MGMDAVIMMTRALQSVAVLVLTQKTDLEIPHVYFLGGFENTEGIFIGPPTMFFEHMD